MIPGVVAGGANKKKDRIITAGTFLASCCATGNATGSNFFKKFDPTLTTWPTWDTNFKSFINEGAYTYIKRASGGGGGTVTAPSVTKTINRFVAGEQWNFSGYVGGAGGDIANTQIEFMNGSSVVHVLACIPNGSFSCVIATGATVGTLIKKPTKNSSPQVNGLLVVSKTGISYTPDYVARSANTMAFTETVNLSSVDSLRITVYALQNSSTSAYGGIMMVNDSPF